MNKDIFIERYKRFEIGDEKINEYLETIINFESYLNIDIEKTSIDDINKYVDYLISKKENTYNNLIHIARYYYYINKSKTSNDEEAQSQMNSWMQDTKKLSKVINQLSQQL